MECSLSPPCSSIRGGQVWPQGHRVLLLARTDEELRGRRRHGHRATSSRRLTDHLCVHFARTGDENGVSIGIAERAVRTDRTHSSCP